MQELPGARNRPASPMRLVACRTVAVAPRDTGALIKALGRALPLSRFSLHHIKRVRRSPAGPEVLLGPLEAVDALPDAEAPWRALDGARLGEAQVSHRAPLTAAEHAEARAQWPCAFHPTAAGHRLPPPMPDAAEQAQMQAWLAAAEAEENGGVVIVSPDAGEVVGAAGVATERDRAHPLRHAPMRAIEAVAQRHRLREDDFEDAAAGKRPREAEDGEQYLCTGYDAYCAVEPCAMCAMAFVHSRVRRVVYARPDAEAGALGSRLALNAEALNHEYRVFRAVQGGGDGQGAAAGGVAEE